MDIRAGQGEGQGMSYRRGLPSHRWSTIAGKASRDVTSSLLLRLFVYTAML
jgi:hypothetical protein